MWTLERRKQLEVLQTLLHEGRMLNSGNRVIERLTLIIEKADELLKSDLRNGESSFMQFLIQEANKDD